MARGENAGLGPEAAGEDDAVAGDMFALAGALDLHGFHLADAVDGDEAGRGQYRHAEGKARQNSRRGGGR